MTATTLSTSINTGITLSPGGAFASPFTVTATGTINSARNVGILSVGSATIDNFGVITGNPDGIFLETGGFVSNDGLIKGNGTVFTASGHSYVASAIEFLGGGTVVNMAAGTIAGTEIAVANTHSSPAALTLQNSGLIETTGTKTQIFQGTTFLPIAVDLFGGGVVTNNAGGVIRGDEVGVLIDAPKGGHANVNNYGTISASGTSLLAQGVFYYPNGVELLNGGTLINEKTGVISADSGVFLTTGTSNAAAQLSNAGTIKGLRDGIVGTSASIINLAGGMITATDQGVVLIGHGSIVNSGSIGATGTTFVNQTGTTISAMGVYIAPTSVLDNNSGGRISSNNIGVVGNTITNAGIITGSSYGIFLDGGGTLNNTAGGNITGGLGVFGIGAANITNAGTITGTNGVFGAAVEVYEPGNSSLVNSGLLQGYYGIGVFGPDAGSLAITNTGTVLGQNSAVEILESFTTAGEGLVTNAGLISSSDLNATYSGTIYTVTALQLGTGATLVNEAGGRVTAPGFAVTDFNGTGSFFVNNAGTISGGAGGIVSGSSQSATIFNSGTITSSLGSAIGLSDGGAVTNAAGGVISGFGGINDNAAGVFMLNQGNITVTRFAMDQITTLTGTVTLDNVGTIVTADEAIGLFETFTVNGAGLVENSGLIIQTATIEVNNGNTYSPTAVQIEGGATLINTGTIQAAGSGIGDYSGGSALIENYGLIAAEQTGISAGGTIFNSGTIIGSLGNAIGLSGGAVTNAAGGVISGANGIYDAAANVLMLNQGSINVTQYALNQSTTLAGTAFLDNAGTIITADQAINLSGNFTFSGAGLVDNSGLIMQTATSEVYNGNTFAPAAVQISGGTTFNNTGTVQAAGDGVGDYSGGGSALIENYARIAADQTGIGTGIGEVATVVNSGIIVNQGTGSAIYFASGGSIDNSGLIESEGPGAAIYLPAGGTITDSGMIEGTGSASSAINAGAAPVTLTLQSGAFISGGVNLSGASGNVLDFASLSHGAINLGGSINGFDSFDFQTGATWAVSGTVPELAGGQTIAGFAATDQIVLEDFTETTASFGTPGLVLNGNIALDITGNFSTSSFTFLDSGGNTTIGLAGGALISEAATGTEAVTSAGPMRFIAPSAPAPIAPTATPTAPLTGMAASTDIPALRTSLNSLYVAPPSATPLLATTVAPAGIIAPSGMFQTAHATAFPLHDASLTHWLG